MISIKVFELGPMANMLYVLYDANTREAAIVDPAWDAAALIKFIEAEKLNLTKVLLTHGHFDHVNALSDILDYKAVPVYFSEFEIPQLTPDVDGYIRTKHNDTVSIGEYEAKIIHTPGHTPGGQCFLFDGHMITGDTLFIGACGRCDFEYSDVHKMYESLHEKLAVVSDDVIIYPGHRLGDPQFDTLGSQRNKNPFLNVPNKDTFIRYRMGC